MEDQVVQPSRASLQEPRHDVDMVFAGEHDIAFCVRLVQDIRADLSLIFLIQSRDAAWQAAPIFSHNGNWAVVREPVYVEPGRSYFISASTDMYIDRSKLFLTPKKTNVMDQVAILQNMLELDNIPFRLRQVFFLHLPNSRECLGICAKHADYVYVEKRGGGLDVDMPSNVSTIKRQHIASSLLVRNSIGSSPDVPLAEPDSEKALCENIISNSFLKSLSKAVKVDLSQYRPTFVMESIYKRCSVLGMSSNEYQDYFAFNTATETAAVEAALFDSDGNSASFSSLHASFVDALTPYLDAKFESCGQTFRAWVVGCGAGVECYALTASVLGEHCKKYTLENIKVFATDIYQPALNAASHLCSASYDEASACSIQGDEAEEALRTQLHGMRSHIVFSRHDVLKEPAFNNLDIIVCRDTLVLLKQTAKRQVLETFNRALSKGGLLLLSAEESFDHISTGFAPVDEVQGLFRKTVNLEFIPGFRGLSHNELSKRRYYAPPLDSLLSNHKRRNRYTDYHAVLDQLIDRRVSAGVLVDQDLVIVHVISDISDFVIPLQPGQFSSHLKSVLKPELASITFELIAQCQQDRRDVSLHNFGWLSESEERRIHISVMYLPDKLIGKDYYAVLFDVEHANDLSETMHIDASSSEAEAMYQRQFKQISEANNHLVFANKQLQSANEYMASYNDSLMKKNALLELRSSAFEHLLEHLPLPILVTNKSKELVYFNSAMQRTLKIDRKQIGEAIDKLRFIGYEHNLFQELTTAISAWQRTGLSYAMKFSFVFQPLDDNFAMLALVDRLSDQSEIFDAKFIDRLHT